MDLTTAQKKLVQTVYEQFRAETAWPTVYAVDRAFMKKVKRGEILSAAAALRGLPEGLIMGSNNRFHASPQDKVILTLSAVARCAGAESDVEACLWAVRWCALQERKRVPLQDTTSIRVNLQEMQRAIPRGLRPDPAAMDRLFTMLEVHYWGSTGCGVPSDGTPRYIDVGQEVRRFAKVRSVEEFMDIRLSWYEGEAQRHRGTLTMAVQSEVAPGPQSRAYLNPDILDRLRAVTGAAWDTTKLVSLATELDFCVSNECVFAAHSLLRALLDHVPPLFGQSGFAGVVSSYPWGQTDKRYLNKLRSFRDQGDDALHRQISKRPDLLRIDDLPDGAAVNVLLQECLTQLSRP